MQRYDARLLDVANELRTGETSLRSSLDRFQQRIEEIEPSIHAFVTEADRSSRLERAGEQLEATDHDRGTRPPLYGVPVGVKDIFHVDGLETKAGSNVPASALDGPQATSVSRLIDAGAVIIGKTVTAEFAYFEPGPTRNPHDIDHTPGGSSSGSAAAVAAGLCPLALGTQTIGSVNRPAAFCGIVGVKPSFDRIPIDGVLPAASSVDHVGFFTQDVAGARLAAGVLYSDWRADDHPTSGMPTIGAVDGPYLEQATDVGRNHFEATLTALENAGFTVERIDPFPDIDAINQRHEDLVAAEMALSHAELYPTYGDRYSDALSTLIEEGLDYRTEVLSQGRAGRTSLREAVHDVMDDHAIDVIVSPSAPGPAPRGIDSTGDPIMNLPWTHSGLPSVTVPSSTTDDGLPIGLQCATRYGFDEWLLSWCRQIAQSLR